MIYSIGIDVGMKGAVCLINESYSIIRNEPMPIDNDYVDDLGMLDLLRSMVPDKYERLFISVEDVHSVQLSGAASNFKFGENKKACEFAAKLVAREFADISYFLKQPKEWQSLAWIDNDKGGNTIKKGTNKHDPKKVSFAAAKRIWPQGNWQISKDGFFDAALIAYATMKEHIKVDRRSGMLPFE